jgi:anti-anti-sigma regulatory factor
MLRITRLAGSQLLVTLLLEGHIRSHWIHQLDSEVNASLGAQQQVVLDFAGVSFVSPEGIKLLRRLRGAGVQFLHCPAIVTDLLK